MTARRPLPGGAPGVPPAPPPPAAPGAVVELTRVSRWFGDVVAVSDVSLAVGPGLTALLGPNGAGKSTLLRMIAGLIPPSVGSVRVFGQDLRARRDLARLVGIVPQQEALFDGLTARRTVALAAVLTGVPDPDGAARAALERVDLDPADTRPVGAYSRGMRQRVKIAQALVADPRLVILDEPLSGVDPRHRRELSGLFVSLAAGGRTVIVSSHVLEEVERLGSRVLVVARGRLVADGDFHRIRALMDDRPHRVRIVTDRPRELAGALLADGAVDAVRVDGTGVEVETSRVAVLRAVLAPVAVACGARLREVVPLDESLESVFRYLVEPA